jgi:hypothetical protein
VFRDYTFFFWLLKLGGLVNLYFLASTVPVPSGADVYVIVPAQILFVVSAYRCFFPVRYEHNVVFHNSVFSSIFVTRLLATFSEIAYIFMFSHVLRLLNVGQVLWVSAFSWLMVAQVVISQGFVWAAILTQRFELYFYEELGWAFIFAANTIASAYLYWMVGAPGGKNVLLQLSLVFGIVYLPWQFIHLNTLRADAKVQMEKTGVVTSSISMRLTSGLMRAVLVKNRRTDADSWGGFIGLTWMTAYWATLIPVWVYYVVWVLGIQRT